jgi:hypothetical protein
MVDVKTRELGHFVSDTDMYGAHFLQLVSDQ